MPVCLQRCRALLSWHGCCIANSSAAQLASPPTHTHTPPSMHQTVLPVCLINLIVHPTPTITTNNHGSVGLGAFPWDRRCECISRRGCRVDRRACLQAAHARQAAPLQQQEQHLLTATAAGFRQAAQERSPPASVSGGAASYPVLVPVALHAAPEFLSAAAAAVQRHNERHPGERTAPLLLLCCSWFSNGTSRYTKRGRKPYNACITSRQGTRSNTSTNSSSSSSGTGGSMAQLRLVGQHRSHTAFRQVSAQPTTVQTPSKPQQPPPPKPVRAPPRCPCNTLAA